MTWHPGTPLVTEHDHRKWRALRRQRILELQRERRASYRRIDYYPSDQALKIIQSQTHCFPGGDYSSVINRLVIESPDSEESTEREASEIRRWLAIP